MTLTVGSLFSGIGGLDLGLERAGMKVLWQSEIDPYASRVLERHWPDVPNLGDVTKIDWENDGLDYGGGIARSLHVDLICGGYPCQPFSVSGRRQGIDDPRHLWPHMRDAVRVLRPRFVLTENVPGHLVLGFDSVLADLAALGFDAEWALVSACSMGAPHLRRRLFCLAHAKSTGLEGHGGPDERLPRVGRTDAEGDGDHWSDEPRVGRLAHGVPRRVDRLRTLGNAVVPQVAEFVGRRILESL